MRGLYIHIPFCKKICSYCDFPKMVSSENRIDNYFKRLLEEINYYNNYLNDIDTVFIGGGTPNSVSIKNLELLFNKIKPILDQSIENTIELNPELITEELLILLKKYNFNRLSIGVQTINDNLLKIINRNHDKELILNKLELIKKYDFNNINLDFIFGIPNENMNDLDNDLNFILSLNMPHISFYNLILEEKTILYHKVEKNEIKMPLDDNDADMYYHIVDILEKNGYKHYETSNFAKEGYQSKHNLKYWDCKEYVGIGLGASGYLNNVRYDNHKLYKDYLNEFIEDKIELSIQDKKSEYFILGLRKCDGVSINEYYKIFKSSPFDDFNLSKLIDEDICEIDNDYFRIKKDKLFISNEALIEFIGDKNEKE